MVWPVSGDRMGCDIFRIIVVRCTETFESAEQETVSVFDQTVHPWCISWSDDVLNSFFLAEIIHVVVLEVGASVRHEGFGDCVFIEYALE